MQIQSEQHKKAVIQALQELKENKAFNLLCEELKVIQKQTESLIFNEGRYSQIGDDRGNKKYSAVDLFIYKRNLLDKFINLNDDLLTFLIADYGASYN